MVLKLSNLFDKNKKEHVEDHGTNMDVLAPERRADGSFVYPAENGLHAADGSMDDHTILHNPDDDQDDLRRYAHQHRLEQGTPVADGSLNENNGGYQSFPDIELPAASGQAPESGLHAQQHVTDSGLTSDFSDTVFEPPQSGHVEHAHQAHQAHQAHHVDHAAHQSVHFPEQGGQHGQMPDHGHGHGLEPVELGHDDQHEDHHDEDISVLEKSAAELEEEHARMMSLREQVESPLYALPFLGRFELQKQIKILFWTALLSLILTIVFAWFNSLSVTQISLRTQLAGDALMYSQRLAKATPNAMNGSEPAFDQLSDSRNNLSNDLQILSEGGSYQDNLVRPATGDAADQLKKVRALWTNSDNAAATIISQKTLLTTFGGTLRQMKELTPELLELGEQIADGKAAADAANKEVEATSELTMLTQRLSRSASEFQSVDGVYPELAFQLRKDSSTFRAIVDGMLNGNSQLGLVATRQDDIRKSLFSLQSTFSNYEKYVNSILGSVQNFSSARQSEQLIFNESEALRTELSSLQGIFRGEAELLTLPFWLMIGFACFTILQAVAIAYITITDGRRRAMEAQLRRYESDEQRVYAQHMEQEAMRTNDQTQAAILRLMNELQEVADGDLTVQATVSEDITGAIADSVNYTVEELRGLVGRVTSTATQVNNASNQAQTTSIELLAAAHKQSRDIQDTSRAVVDMAAQITEVSRSASESADVARQSVGAAQQGMLAVQNAIAGMNGIREQIQETSKRIKRLGESSQEIGEIIELISDITEQTNVLALNAAIQAASAGDAGRGFSVVAEEVQRLAERSGNATKQIGALVRTIQTDTQAAVIAMEKSTAGVVDGARLSDAAGAALTDIGTVSNRLADLIESISANTQEQADSATEVASNMQNILEVTEQTREGTRQTALSIRELSKLAEDLRSSVSRFRIANI